MGALGGDRAFSYALVRPLSRPIPPFGELPLTALLRPSILVLRRTALDPELPFEVGHVNGR